MTTWSYRCPHGELWAVCRECPPDVDPLRPPLTDEEPWTIPTDEEAHPHLRLIALVALIAAVALVFTIGRMPR